MNWFTLAAVTRLAVGSGLCLGSLAALAEEPKDEGLHIEAQPLSSALREFSEQTGLQIGYAAELAEGKDTPGVAGVDDPEIALDALLAKSGLEHRFVNAQTVVIRAVETSEAEDEAEDPGNGRTTPRPVIMAQASREKNNQTSRNPSSSQEKQDEQNAKEKSIQPIEEIVVTGTQIRGARNIASPISIHTREDIERTGAGSIARFMLTLPANFQGGASAGSTGAVTAGGGQAINAVNGASINLRGLGDDSTLTLVNGRRVAPGNHRGNFVDTSTIPSAAVERVEVVPDGASALYGSDAVGGVVNFIMRKDFEGAETRARYGAVTEGNLHEVQLAQTLGFAWESGSTLLSYEYVDQTALPFNDKSWASPVRGVMDAVSEQTRHGTFVSLDQAIGEIAEFFANATYSNRVDDRRHSYGSATRPLTQQNYHADIDSFGITGGVRLNLLEAQDFELAASYGASSTKREVLNLLSGAAAIHSDTDTSVLAIDGKLTGSLPPLATGAVLYAVGAQYREETYEDFNLLTNLRRIESDRHLWAAFAELRVPIIGSGAEPDNSTLELTIAGRFEEYSDFGSTANPKIGLIWQPLRNLRLRGTWGTAFKAPLLNDLDPIHNQLAVNLIFDPNATPPGNVPVAFLSGGNPGLQPEEAKTWTVGFDWTPEYLSGLSAKATYYNIDYTDRITSPQQALFPLFNAQTDVLRFQNIAGPFIDLTPSLAELESFIVNSRRFDDFTGIPGGVDLSKIEAVIDYRMTNLTSVQTSGFDFSLSNAWDHVEVGVDGTYILNLENQIVPAVPAIDIVDTVFNPADLKLRARATFSTGALNAGLFVNYIDSYKDQRGGDVVSVKSWTTVDLNVDYQFEHETGPLKGLSINVGAVNLTDNPPPRIAPQLEDFYAWVVFDPANADPRGRFLYAQVTKEF